MENADTALRYTFFLRYIVLLYVMDRPLVRVTHLYLFTMIYSNLICVLASLYIIIVCFALYIYSKYRLANSSTRKKSMIVILFSQIMNIFFTN